MKSFKKFKEKCDEIDGIITGWSVAVLMGLSILVVGSSMIFALVAGFSDPGEFSVHEEVAIRMSERWLKNNEDYVDMGLKKHNEIILSKADEFEAACKLFPELKSATEGMSVPVETYVIVNTITGFYEFYFPNGVGVMMPLDFDQETLAAYAMFGVVPDEIKTFKYETSMFFMFYLSKSEL